MKKLLIGLMFLVSFVPSLFAALPDTFPSKYASWINHQQYTEGNFQFDFHNLESSFSQNVCGTDNKTCDGSWYKQKVAKYIISNREVFDSSVPFCFSLNINTECKAKDILQAAIPTFKLNYDGKTIALEELLCVSLVDGDKKVNCSSIDFLGYLDKDLFQTMAKASAITLQFELDGVKYNFNLQNPQCYPETFVIEY